KAVLFCIVENGAQATDLASPYAGPSVDDHSSDRHRRTALEHPRLLFVDAKSLVLRDVADPGEQVAGVLCLLGAGIRRERTIVGVTGVLVAELGRDARQSRIEPPSNQVRKRRARAGTLRKGTRSGSHVKRSAGIFNRPPRRFRTQQSQDRRGGGRV